jgi:purine-nucleoside phosphorylase
MRNEFAVESLPPMARRFKPAWGVVLGSGLGSFVDAMDVSLSVPLGHVAGLPVSAVNGHSGKIVFGTLAGVSIVVMQGRVHLYEGHLERAVTAGIRLLAALGIRNLLLTNAAGTINPDLRPGTWMLISDHLNLTGKSPLTGGPNFLDMTEVYSIELRERFLAAAVQHDITLNEGVYAATPGPQYETPAEIRMFRTLGADAVGMSTVLEAIQARALGIRVAGISCLTNWGAGLSKRAPVHGEVLKMGKSAGPELARLVFAVVSETRSQ